MKNRIAIGFITSITLLLSSTAFAQVWAPQSSSGGGGSSLSCYAVMFDTGSYGRRMLHGNGTVSGSTFTGFLRGNPNGQNSGTSYFYQCGNMIAASTGDCAWNYANNNGYSNYTVGVFALPIVSAQAIACF